MKPTTKMFYLQDGGNHCPYCKSKSINSGGDMEIISGRMTQTTRCETCGKNWIDIYYLEDMEDSEGTPIKLNMGDLYSLEEFVARVNDGDFIDYDGSGYYGSSGFYFRSKPARPSEIKRGIIRKEYNYVMWFNK